MDALLGDTDMESNMESIWLARHSRAIERIGHARLLSLPKQLKDLLKEPKMDLKTKTLILEEIADLIDRR